MCPGTALARPIAVRSSARAVQKSTLQLTAPSSCVKGLRVPLQIEVPPAVLLAFLTPGGRVHQRDCLHRDSGFEPGLNRDRKLLCGGRSAVVAPTANLSVKFRASPLRQATWGPSQGQFGHYSKAERQPPVSARVRGHRRALPSSNRKILNPQFANRLCSFDQLATRFRAVLNHDDHPGIELPL